VQDLRASCGHAYDQATKILALSFALHHAIQHCIVIQCLRQVWNGCGEGLFVKIYAALHAIT